MPVYGSDERQLGAVAAVRGDTIEVGGRSIPRSAVARVQGGRVYLNEAGARCGAGGGQRGERREGEIAVPVAEERLRVEKQEAELGAVEVRKTVEEEEQRVPVELEREEVRVERRDVGDRPAAGEDLFREGTVRVPVRGEEAQVTKEAVVTGEVVVEKERTTERQAVTDTVRRERAEVEDTSQRARAGMAEMGGAEARTGAMATGGQAATAGAGAAAGRAAGVGGQAREGMEVVGSDGARVGLVKEVRVGDILVDRPMQRDLYVPLDVIREVTGAGVVLTIPADEADNQGWPNPPLF